MSAGDREKELSLPFSPLCDRASTLVPESQIGFIDFIVAPTFTVLGDIIEKVTSEELGSENNENTLKLLTEVIDEVNEACGAETSSGQKLLSPSEADSLFNFVLNRVWEPFLTQNKSNWQALSKRGQFHFHFHFTPLLVIIITFLLLVM